MQFKHPELLYFLFLLIIPILVHLFQLRRFKKQYFTNVKFLRELSMQTRKSSKIKKWLLLSTRLLILACMVFAFAQPFFQAKDNSNATNEMFIILDNSFSMQAKGQNGELLKRAVQDLLESVPENTTFSLLTNSQTFWNTDIRAVQSDLQNLQYSASPFRPEELIAKVKARKSPYEKDLLIITDAVGVSAKQFQNAEKERTFVIVPEAEQLGNAAIDSVFLKATSENFYEIGINVSKFGERTDVPVALYNNGKLVAKTLVAFDGNKSTVSFNIPKADFHGYAEIVDNGLSYDNAFYFSISKPRKTNVLSIGDNAKSSFLSRIYTPGEFNFRNSEIAALDYNVIDEQDAIVLNELKDIPQALQTTLKAFVQKGGNVILIPAKDAQLTNLNAALANFGNMQMQQSATREKPVTRISFSHPLYAGVFEKKIENFQYPVVQQSYNIIGNSPAILGFEDQQVFLTAIRNPLSSVYIFAAAISKENSNFQNSPLIVPTFYNMAQTIGKTGINAIAIGSSDPLIVEAQMAKDQIITVRNDAENFIPIQQVLNNKVRLSFGDMPHTAGNFGAFKNNELVKNISFNYPRTESDLSAANTTLGQDYNIVESIDGVFDTLQTERTDNELWKIFVILTLLFLVAELLIQKLVK